MANTYNDTDWSTDGNTKATATSSTTQNVSLDGTLSVTGNVTTAGNLTITGKLVEGRTVIKVPASAFHGNDDDSGTTGSIAYVDDGDDGDASSIGVRVGDADGELYAWVDVPLGYTATKVRVYGDDTANEVEVYTWNITDGSKGSEISNSGLTVDDDTVLGTNHVGSDTNMLLIRVKVASTVDRVWGAVVTIEAT